MLFVRLACLTCELETHAEYLALSDGGTASALPLCNKKIKNHETLFSFFPPPKGAIAFEITLHEQLLGNIGSCHVPTLARAIAQRLEGIFQRKKNNTPALALQIKSHCGVLLDGKRAVR